MLYNTHSTTHIKLKPNEGSTYNVAELLRLNSKKIRLRHRFSLSKTRQAAAFLVPELTSF
ncbi:hypothetical protein N7475_008429 [Penicillium sp. IBT 31633x]|nr:hypothetical protein N7475_008429 [Penicillium sp. IBT 31633x]